MRNKLQRIGITSWSMLGRCGYCMRAAATSALVTWLIALPISAATSNPFIAMAAIGTSSALTLLWIAHISAYALRSAQCKLRTPTVAEDGTAAYQSRRDLFPMFAKAFVLVALATAIPSVFQAARAQDDSGCSGDTPAPCGTQYCCAAPAVWFCQGYTGTSQPWAQLGTFCTRANSDEDVADLRANCAMLIAC